MKEPELKVGMTDADSAGKKYNEEITDVSAAGKVIITKTLELSTAHISQETNSLLLESQTTDCHFPLIVYNKPDYGYWIVVPSEASDWEYAQDHIPKELMGILQYAKERDCSWVMLDRDAYEIEELPTYEW